MNAQSVLRTTTGPVTFNLDFKYKIYFFNLIAFEKPYFYRWFLCFLLLCTACHWLLPEEKQSAFLLANVARLFLKYVIIVYSTQNKQTTACTLLRIICLGSDVFRFINYLQLYIYSVSYGPY